MRVYAGADWMASNVKYLRKGKKQSLLGRELNEFERTVADILGATFQGIYHIEEAVMHGEWAGRWVRISLDRSLSTFDFDHLTSLVVLCHDAAVRLDLGPANLRHLALMFHPREREGSTSSRHPTIEAAIERTRTQRADMRPPEEKP